MIKNGSSIGDIILTTLIINLHQRSLWGIFTDHGVPFPARSCVEVARLPKDTLIGIEAIALYR
ncbi:Rid family hydrolase [Edwardsiella ictaluri]|nr:Rid family hydrolase [Edwardsiella ictaluri]